MGSYKPGDTIWELFTTAAGSGAAANADALPAATLVRNGSDTAETLTVANVDTGRYTITGTIPGGYAAGDKLHVAIAATIGGTAVKAVLSLGVLDSKRNADLNDLSAAQVNAEADTALADYGALKPTTAGRTLDVSAGGEAGIDWANVGSPTTAVNLAGTTVGSVTGTVGGVAGTLATLDALAADLATDHGAGSWATATGFSTLDATAVQTAATAALNAYDPPTKAELDAAVAGITVPTTAAIADAVWDEAQAGHTTAGTFGAYLDAAISGISTGGGGDATLANQTTMLTRLTAIQTKTDSLTFTVAGVVDANVTHALGTAMEAGDGTFAAVGSGVVTLPAAFPDDDSMADAVLQLVGGSGAAGQLLILGAATANAREYSVAFGSTTGLDTTTEFIVLGSLRVTDKTGYSISGTTTTLDALATALATAHGAGSWATATGFSTFDPATDGVSVGKVLGTTLTETTPGRLAGNLSLFWGNNDAATTKVADDVGSGAGSGTADWTTTERAQIRYRLGIDGTESAPVTNTDLHLGTVDANTVAVLGSAVDPDAVPQVNAVTVADKTGYALAATGLDAVPVTAPTGAATTFREMLVQVWRRHFRKATKTANQLKTYADDGSTVLTTQAVADDGTTETLGAAS